MSEGGRGKDVCGDVHPAYVYVCQGWLQPSSVRGQGSLGAGWWCDSASFCTPACALAWFCACLQCDWLQPGPAGPAHIWQAHGAAAAAQSAAYSAAAACPACAAAGASGRSQWCRWPCPEGCAVALPSQQGRAHLQRPQLAVRSLWPWRCAGSVQGMRCRAKLVVGVIEVLG